MIDFRLTRIVGSADLDALEHVNNVRYLEWVQDASRDHWNSICEEAWSRNFLWVVRSHHITYFASAILGDTLEVRTFVEAMKGSVSTRVVQFRKQGFKELLAECKTDWVLLKKPSLRPARIPAEMTQLLLPDSQ